MKSSNYGFLDTIVKVLYKIIKQISSLEFESSLELAPEIKALFQAFQADR